ncbi:S49 family peptidase [Dyadobacter sp. LHD-138]|uniref:S49 family peptidase n=1 Tax=Dyadobacter sp. LHD-138 TaxID=3071413 RepID=UPI0027DF323E|nr:S49 family peptidase [Dyadobacter sp. LHD-138]MDQ6479812.1 S49 family peptidase [Dyadobacter sp. LHD-138]
MLHQLLTEKWALEPRFHERMAMLALSDKLDFKSFKIDRKQPYFEAGSGNAWYYGELPKMSTKKGMVAVIPLMGTMTRNGDLCSWGTEDVGAWLLEAYADTSVIGVVLEINSGGGSVDGTELLAEIVRQRNKPVVAYVLGVCASAAYWVASQCDEIVMESAASSEVGSIGVLAMHVDSSQAYEKEGHKITIIRADGSEAKALFNSVEKLTDEIILATKAEMKPIRNEFVRQVKAGRPAITDESIFEGGMYNGAVAITNGMADSIGFLGDAVTRVIKLDNQLNAAA